VKLVLASISTARTRPKAAPADVLSTEYLTRSARYTPSEPKTFDSEVALLTWLDRQSARTTPALILCDSRGEQLTSEELAARLGRLRDAGTQLIVLAIGPADGWTTVARSRATLIVAFGRITLPHELARTVLAEQIYRALTILAGHPYHSGH